MFLVGLPVIGNLLELPDKHAWLKFHEYIREYGPIVRLTIMGQDHVLLGTEKVVDDLAKARGAIYNGRPQAPASSLLTKDINLLMMPYGKGWQARRRFVQQLTSQMVAPTYEPFQWLEAFKMINDIVHDPADYQECFEHFTMAMGSRMLYGRPMPGRMDEQREIMDVTHTLERVVQPGAFIMDILPWLRFLPDVIAPGKTWLKGMAKRDEDFYFKMWNRTLEDKARGIDAKSWARLCQENQERHGLTELEAIHLLGLNYQAFGTTSANLMNFTLAMVRHPEWFPRMHAEMDALITAETGRPDGRLPTVDDLPNLPLLRAVLAETTRVWPVTPAGVPHMLTQDDVYEGYHLKAGTVVHLVTWATGRDPERYPDPDSFKPERWLEPSYPTYREPLTEFPTLLNTMMFGAGRRSCPGMLVGAKNVYIQVMMLVWACNLRRAKDKKGEEIVPPFYDFVSGFNVFPKPFKFKMSPRSETRMKMVEEAYQKALREDSMSVH